MADSQKQAATTATGQMHGLRLGFDKTGRPYIEGKFVLQHVDDFALLLKQSQALEVAFTFETKSELLELFPDYVQFVPGAPLVDRRELEGRLNDGLAEAGIEGKVTVGSRPTA